MTEAIGEIIYTLLVVVMGMSLVGILYFVFLVILGLVSDIITMSITAGAIFFLYVTIFGGGDPSQGFNFICWEPGIWIFAPISAFVIVLFANIVGD